MPKKNTSKPRTRRVLRDEWWELEDREGFRYSRPGDTCEWWTKVPGRWQRFDADRMAPGSGGGHGGSCLDSVKLQFPERGPFTTFHIRRFRKVRA